MSTFQQNHSNGFSPILLSPSSTSNTTITNNHILLFDNSDQGSVDSDYTSLGSSKFYGNGGSTSSLNRQGRSQSIDELASTTTIPTRHFNGTLNVNKLNNDPLQFVKVHPNHDLIERAQEQLTLLESRKRLQENFKLNNNNNTNNNINTNKINNNNNNDEDNDTDWSKAVENWRQKREQKRKQSVNSNRTDDDIPIAEPNNESYPSSPIRKFDERETKPTCPPPPPPKVVPSIFSTNTSSRQLIPDRTKSKSPSPQRIKGPAKIHEIFIQKPIDIRGFGFKLDGGSSQNRPIFISTLEDGSPADKAGLCVDDEVISMNDENIEHMTFDQVRKILKERNLRGSIKMIVKTYEDIIDDNSQTVTTGPPTEHSRTPSPQKPLFNSHLNTPPPSISTTTSTIRLSTTTPPNLPSPVYTFLPFTPPPPSISSSDTTTTTTNVTLQRTPPPPPPLNMFAPKPFRSTTSNNPDTQNTNDTTTVTSEQQSSALSKATTRNVVNTLLSNPILISSSIIDPPSLIATNSKPPPPPLTSIESLLHGRSDINNNDQYRNDSPIAQVRSSVEKQMNQLQQELLLGFPHSHSSSNDSKREHRTVDIPVDLTYAAVPNSPIIKSSSSLPSSIQQQEDSNGLKLNSNEHVVHYLETSPQQRPSTNNTKRSVQDLPSMTTTTTTNRPSTAHSTDPTFNELRVNVSSPYAFQQQQQPQQKKVSIQLDEKIPQQRITSKQLHTTLNQAPKKSHYEDHSWINEDQRRSLMTSPLSLHNNNGRNSGGSNGSGRRSASLTPHHHELQMNRQSTNQLTMFHYGDHTDEQHHHHQSRNTQQARDYDPSLNKHHQSRQHRIKSPIRTTINSNNNRVLSVSGKLRCSKCTDELGQGSAMVIESLGLYYHIECFRCFVCNIPLSSSFEGTDVRVRSNRLHCQNCFSDENGAWKSNV